MFWTFDWTEKKVGVLECSVHSTGAEVRVRVLECSVHLSRAEKKVGVWECTVHLTEVDTTEFECPVSSTGTLVG